MIRSMRLVNVSRGLFRQQNRWFASEAAATADTLKLNFFVPSEPIVSGKPVTQVTVPGSEGMFGILPNHVPTVAEMQPGLVTVDLDGETLKYFVSGGFTFVHADSVADISAAEAVSVEDIDLDKVRKNLAEAESQLSSLGEGSENDATRAEVEISLSVYREILASTAV